jgi:hypothetical protein
MDFTFCFLREKVFSAKPTTICGLKKAIIEEARKVLNSLLRNVCHSVIDCYEKCANADGQHFEHL